MIEHNRIYLERNRHLLENKTVLDLAFHDGSFTETISNLSPKYIYGVEARKESVEKAKVLIPNNAKFFVGDITDPTVMNPLVEKSNIVVALGVFYHLYNHFGFLSLILKPHIEHVLIETIAGPESLNPEMFWGFETTAEDNVRSGWHPVAPVIPNGSPNLAWIFQAARIFGFECDWVCHYGSLKPKTRENVTLGEYTAIRDDTWPEYDEFISGIDLPDHVLSDIETMLGSDSDSGAQKRIFLRLYNKNLVDSTPVDIKSCYIWNPNNEC